MCLYYYYIKSNCGSIFKDEVDRCNCYYLQAINTDVTQEVIILNVGSYLVFTVSPQSES
jgi:hypothetical protein